MMAKKQRRRIDLNILGSAGTEGVVMPVKLARSLSFSNCLP